MGRRLSCLGSAATEEEVKEEADADLFVVLLSVNT